MLAANEVMRAERDLQQKDAIDSLQRQIDLAEVERQRRVRLMAEDELARIENETDEEVRKNALLNQVDQNMERQLLQEFQRWRAQQRKEREKLLESELDAAAEEAEARARRLREMERHERQREWRQRVQSLYDAEKEGILNEEKEMHNILLRLEEEKAQDQRLEREVVFKNQIMKDQLAHQRAMRKTEERVLQRERERYAKLRDELGQQLTAEENEMIRQHEEIMARLIVQNERQLKEYAQSVRRNARKDELERLKKEYMAGQKQIDTTRRALEAQEQELLLSVQRKREEEDDDGRGGDGGGVFVRIENDEDEEKKTKNKEQSGVTTTTTTTTSAFDEYDISMDIEYDTTTGDFVGNRELSSLQQDEEVIAAANRVVEQYRRRQQQQQQQVKTT
eukprot:TRINITY_DN65703_c2_g2_i1.p1 TRINITY_DN65703_c2_g2~~TRINITY_DN65703_c2_g2_i1.p1  ORF type:complete len:439 (-),score=291.57 TRINITY_DN65703_c2_g2_i1:181-1362(-)